MADGFNVLIGSDGAALNLLKQEFPTADFLELPSYQIEYSKNGKKFMWKMILRSPKVAKAIHEENKLLKEKVVYNISLLDDRYKKKQSIYYSKFIANLPLMRNIDNKNNLVQHGAYPIIDFNDYNATVLATGSEVEIAVQSSYNLLKEKINVRVISFPSWELFTKQSIEYQKKILGNQPLFGIEAGIINGWEKYLPANNFIGMRSFGASGPYKKLYKHFGLTSENLINLIKNNI